MPAPILRDAIEISSDRRHVGKVTALITSLLEPLRLSEADVFDLCFCVEEALINAIEHGNEGDGQKKVTVSWVVDSAKIEFVVRDEGPGYRPGQVPDPTLDENLLKEGGRGLFLICQLMDEVRHNTRGNAITMRKFR